MGSKSLIFFLLHKDQSRSNLYEMTYWYLFLWNYISNRMRRKHVQYVCVLRPASSRPGLLTFGSFLEHRLSSQTNTSLFCTLCPHTCAPRKNFPVGHPSPNCSGPSTLNLGVLWRPASGKEVVTCWYEYPINPIKPWVGVSQRCDSRIKWNRSGERLGKQ